MSAYIDAMMKGPRKGAAGPLWCHLIADTIDELHEFAQRIGLQRAWFQPHPRHPHYDIGSERIRAVAVRLGAVECDRRTFVNHKRRIAGEPPLATIEQPKEQP